MLHNFVHNEIKGYEKIADIGQITHIINSAFMKIRKIEKKSIREILAHNEKRAFGFGALKWILVFFNLLIKTEFFEKEFEVFVPYVKELQERLSTEDFEPTKKPKIGLSEK